MANIFVEVSQDLEFELHLLTEIFTEESYDLYSIGLSE